MNEYQLGVRVRSLLPVGYGEARKAPIGLVFQVIGIRRPFVGEINVAAVGRVRLAKFRVKRNPRHTRVRMIKHLRTNVEKHVLSGRVRIVLERISDT